jgi:hypothetical protein
MSSIIQRKAAFATNVGSGSVAVTLDSPVSAGSKLVIACGLVQTDGSGSSAPSILVVDDLTNGYSPTAYSSSGSGFFANTYQGGGIANAGARTYTLSYTAPTGQSGYTFLAGICVYELSDANVFTSESGNQSLSGLHKISDLSASISALSGGTYGNLLVSIFAGTFTSTLTDAQAVAAGSGWTLDGRGAVNGAFSPIAIAFESQLVGPTSNPAATFSGSGNNTELDGTILVAAYSLTSAIPGGSGGGGGSTPSGPVFLGSIRIVGSAPAGAKVPYLGTVKVVTSAPSGASNPYLGSVVLGTPGAGTGNPTLGEVVVVPQVPAGATDDFLGSVEEAS